jgi:hypothetical protein
VHHRLVATGLLVLALVGCDSAPRCGSVVFVGQIDVRLDTTWDPADAARLLLTVACPGGDAGKCGFLNGELSGPATAPLTAETVLRPARIAVRLTDTTSGAVVRELEADVDFRPMGRQSACGGQALARVVVPPAVTAS